MTPEEQLAWIANHVEYIRAGGNWIRMGWVDDEGNSHRTIGDTFAHAADPLTGSLIDAVEKAYLENE